MNPIFLVSKQITYFFHFQLLPENFRDCPKKISSPD